MPEGRTTTAARQLLVELKRLLADRAQREVAVEREHRAAVAAAESALAAANSEAQSRRDEDLAQIVQRQEHDRATASARSSQDRAANDRARTTAIADLRERVDRENQRARQRLQEAVWMAETLYEPHAHKPREKFDATKKAVEQALQDVLVVERSAADVLRRLGRPPLTVNNGRTEPQGIESIQQEVSRAQQGFVRLDGLMLPRLTTLPMMVIYVLLAAAGGGAGAAALQQWKLVPWERIAGGAAGGAVVMALLCAGAATIGRRQVARVAAGLSAAIGFVRGSAAATIELAAATRAKEDQALREPRDREIRAAREAHELTMVEISRVHQDRVREIEAKHAENIARFASREQEIGREATESAERDRRIVVESCETTLAEAKRRHTDAIAKAQASYDRQWGELQRDWQTGMEDVRRRLADVHAAAAPTSTPIAAAAAPGWTPAAGIPTAIRIGDLAVDLSSLPGGLPTDPRLALSGSSHISLPAMLEVPDRASLLVQSGQEGRAAAIATLQAVMLRLLTAFPPGKVKFTLMDPVGLGESFAGFMHLADFDPGLITDRVWTEPRHIEARLLDLTEHMETVIQKYLRNEFATIDEYNQQAGEVAEPYRFLVIADFPVNFDEASAKRLASIIASGPRCGVYALLAMDTRRQMPAGIHLSDLEKACVRLVYRRNGLALEEPEFASLPLSLDQTPPSEQFTAVVHAVGAASKDAGRVQVPFRHVSPPGELWQGSTAADVRVPVGRAGATKLQHMVLGRGTAQHALIAGRTGSGKSTLLHVIITSLAMWYSPDEVELYLIDFKKGVEFKTYALHDLPHARVVAIESEREFGISVLRRLDAEMKRRGEIFRDLVVQDMASYREAAPGKPLPRILLIVDEFQELFVEDDKLAQEAALLLDRLVRQGRAFGMHVVLGSQTLGGAFSLARSTIGQMAVRIALQCAEADSYLILSDDNAAARLLARPGEAIYNDASGAVQGNSPFQVAWLDDMERDVILGRIKDRDIASGKPPREPMIVFEGHAPADIARNHAIAMRLSGSTAGFPTAPIACLGEPIAIKEPTGAVLRRQAGSNLLVVGQRDEAALGLITAATLSLAVQSPSGADGARFIVLDGSTPDSPTAGILTSHCSGLPHQFRHVDYRDVPAVMAEIASEVAARQEQDRADRPPIYLVIYGLQRYRMLRRPENEFDFSSDGQAATPDKQFAAILRDGPAVGIHVLAWCDTAATLGRTLDRQAARTFDHRVLFQMSATDSSGLIDTPAASMLGPNRALYFNEEQGLTEKFRPYALPEPRWLNTLRSALCKPAAAS